MFKFFFYLIWFNLFFTDLLLLEGLEAVFRITLSLLKTHEDRLLSCDSFEEIMNYFKTVVCNIQLDQINAVISQVIDQLSLIKDILFYNR